MSKKTPFPSIAERIASGGVLEFAGEFCPWANISVVTGYALIKAGKLKTSKIGSKRVITVPNALAFRNSLGDGEAA